MEGSERPTAFYGKAFSSTVKLQFRKRKDFFSGKLFLSYINSPLTCTWHYLLRFKWKSSEQPTTFYGNAFYGSSGGGDWEWRHARSGRDVPWRAGRSRAASLAMGGECVIACDGQRVCHRLRWAAGVSSLAVAASDGACLIMNG